jgi:endonuclease/exonuclease/phosphatase family metal-dependent hydrolase
MTLAILLLFVFQIFPLPLIQKSATPKGKSEQVQTKETKSDNDAHLLESGEPRSKRGATTPNTEIRVISYNIRWRSGDKLKEIIENFRKDEELGKPTILALQEVDRNKKRSGKTNTAKLIADELSLHYAWTAPPTAKLNEEEETGVAILSIYPLTNVKRIVLPHEGPNGRRRVAIGATVKIGDQELRVYSAHAETRVSMEKKLDQLKALLEDLAQQPPETPAIIMGDLNTWQGDAAPRTIKLFSDAGFSTPFGSEKTFSQRVLLVPIQFRLDWIWLRGLEAVNHGIDRELEVSDHWPLWTIVRIPSPKNVEQQ